jgi:hypothetical protein
VCTSEAPPPPKGAPPAAGQGITKNELPRNARENEMATAIVITVLVVGGFVAVFFVLDRVLRAVSREVDNRD